MSDYAIMANTGFHHFLSLPVAATGSHHEKHLQ